MCLLELTSDHTVNIVCSVDRADHARGGLVEVRYLVNWALHGIERRRVIPVQYHHRRRYYAHVPRVSIAFSHDARTETVTISVEDIPGRTVECAKRSTTCHPYRHSLRTYYTAFIQLACMMDRARIFCQSSWKGLSAKHRPHTFLCVASPSFRFLHHPHDTSYPGFPSNCRPHLSLSLIRGETATVFHHDGNSREVSYSRRVILDLACFQPWACEQ